jgi:mevalonate kinase
MARMTSPSVLSLTDEELKRIGERAEHYAFSGEHALRSGAGIGVSRAISLATIEVLDGASRELHRKEARRDRSGEQEALRRLGVGR